MKILIEMKFTANDGKRSKERVPNASCQKIFATATIVNTKLNVGPGILLPQRPQVFKQQANKWLCQKESSSHSRIFFPFFPFFLSFMALGVFGSLGVFFPFLHFIFPPFPPLPLP